MTGNSAGTLVFVRSSDLTGAVFEAAGLTGLSWPKASVTRKTRIRPQNTTLELSFIIYYPFRLVGCQSSVRRRGRILTLPPPATARWDRRALRSREQAGGNRSLGLLRQALSM